VDYKLAVTLAEAKVRDAESKLELAKELAAAAKEEWRALYSQGQKGNREPSPLVAKEPQLAAAKARLEAEKADLKKALLNLERTQLKAPFRGRVGQEGVGIGQFVTHGQALATLYSTEAAEIVVPLEVEDLAWFQVPGFTRGDGPGPPATVKARIAGKGLTWEGRVVRTEGKLDERTRMINVIIRVNKPYDTKPPLAFGLFVTVDIKGRPITNATVIPRAALRQGDVVWVVTEDGLLRFRKVEVARIQGDKVLIKPGLKDGEMVVISSLMAVNDGMSVRTVPAKEENKP
jgi:RND family efflux transporter MFP subunit